MNKPAWYGNLKKWRKANGLTSQEWEYYAEARNTQTWALMSMAFIIGLIGGVTWN